MILLSQGPKGVIAQSKSIQGQFNQTSGSLSCRVGSRVLFLDSTEGFYGCVSISTEIFFSTIVWLDGFFWDYHSKTIGKFSDRILALPQEYESYRGVLGTVLRVLELLGRARLSMVDRKLLSAAQQSLRDMEQLPGWGE